MIKKLVFRHYGSNAFSKDRFMPVSNDLSPWNKPKPGSGLWASPEGERFYTWKDWCEDEEYGECDKANSFCFTLKPEANIFILRSKSDVDALYDLCGESLKCVGHISQYVFNFEKLHECGYDGLMTLISEDRELYYLMYGWDCDSIVIFNPEIVLPT